MPPPPSGTPRPSPRSQGMGANVIRNGKLAPAWRENTLRSFKAAAESGAAFVEFDVQVTADGVPVIWHDDTVEYGNPARPTRCAVADLTAAEFQALGELSASGTCQQLSVVRRFHSAGTGAAADADPADSGTPEPEEDLLHPRQRWCCEDDDGFPTLEQLFTVLPPSLAFNIEVKMATPPDLAVTPEGEIGRVVLPVLDVVARCAAAAAAASDAPPRQVVFSSFDPDVCAALRTAQSALPVLFLSTGGRDWHADARRMSLGAALDFAAAGGLAGIVVDSGVLQQQPATAAAAAAAGLRLLTYGLENDSPDWVMQQQALGVTGVIVDDVAGLMGALGGGSSAAARVPAGGQHTLLGAADEGTVVSAAPPAAAVVPAIAAS